MRLFSSIPILIFVILVLTSCDASIKNDSPSADAAGEYEPVDANTEPGSSVCGNGLCEPGESSLSCAADCSDSLCTESCQYSMDGACDDGGSGAEFNVCVLGSDCADCGSRGSCENISDGSCPLGCPLDPDCGDTCEPSCPLTGCGDDGCGGFCGCPGTQVCAGTVCEDDTSVVNVGASCTACNGQILGLRCLAPNQQAECGGDPSTGGNGWCTRSNLDTTGYCTKMCNDISDCPASFGCIDASGGRFCLQN
ncbi:MAG: hypothetical protein JKY56_03915 [Kofleriaceae bacterium]|nr:hypothetical protein [Kofleriaceae bacterium]